MGRGKLSRASEKTREHAQDTYWPRRERASATDGGVFSSASLSLPLWRPSPFGLYANMDSLDNFFFFAV